LEQMNGQFFPNKIQAQKEPLLNAQNPQKLNERELALAATLDGATELANAPSKDGRTHDDFKMPAFFPVNGRTVSPMNPMPPSALPTTPEMNAQASAMAQAQATTSSQAEVPDEEATAEDFVPAPQVFMKPISSAGSSSLEPAGPVQLKQAAEQTQGDIETPALAAATRKEVTGDKDEGSEGGDSDSGPTFQSFQSSNQVKPQDAILGASASHAFTVPKPGEDSANVRNLIQGAQLLIQKGGGEMKVQLHPEGMGTVDLKVAVNKGRVDIQMLAESNETKRLLESGLSDLKDSLIGHKLNVDTVKVDVANNKNFANLDSQLGNQQREMAREFLGQFRDQNQANRQIFGDTTGLKNYAKRSKILTPADVPSSGRAKESSRRLDLVA